MSTISTFMDFCSGIGGGRLGLEKNGLTCVGYSEIQSSSDATYRLFFGTKELNYGDLMQIDTKHLPNFDMMIAGFPCQTFSIAGKRAGFEDDRGNIIYGLVRILCKKKVKCFLLENVKGLVNHDKGRTLKIIISLLLEAGYTVFYSVLDSSNFGVPQKRERIYIVGFHSNLGITDFTFPEKSTYLINFSEDQKELSDILCPKTFQLFNKENPTFKKYLSNKYNQGRYTYDELVDTDFKIIDTRHSDLRIYENVTPTLRTGRHGILYAYENKLWHLSGFEALKLQGFGDDLVDKVERHHVVSNTTLLSQAGNAMTVNVISSITEKIIEKIGSVSNDIRKDEQERI